MSDRHNRRSLDSSSEEAETLKKARRKKLEVNVIEFDDRDQAQVLGHVSHLLGVCCREIEGEPEEVLALWTAAMASVIAEASEPTSKYHVRINLSHDGCTLDEVIVEREELVEELIGR